MESELDSGSEVSSEDLYAQSDIESDLDLDSEALSDFEDDDTPPHLVLAQMGFNEEQIDKFTQGLALA